MPILKPTIYSINSNTWKDACEKLDVKKLTQLALKVQRQPAVFQNQDPENQLLLLVLQNRTGRPFTKLECAGLLLQMPSVVKNEISNDFSLTSKMLDEQLLDCAEILIKAIQKAVDCTIMKYDLDLQGKLQELRVRYAELHSELEHLKNSPSYKEAPGIGARSLNRSSDLSTPPSQLFQRALQGRNSQTRTNTDRVSSQEVYVPIGNREEQGKSVSARAKTRCVIS